MKPEKQPQRLGRGGLKNDTAGAGGGRENQLISMHVKEQQKSRKLKNHHRRIIEI